MTMQLTSLDFLPCRASACFWANIAGSDTPSPARLPTCKKCRRLTDSQLRSVVGNRLSMAEISASGVTRWEGKAGGIAQLLYRPLRTDQCIYMGLASTFIGLETIPPFEVFSRPKIDRNSPPRP